VYRQRACFVQKRDSISLLALSRAGLNRWARDYLTLEEIEARKGAQRLIPERLCTFAAQATTQSLWKLRTMQG
jgi:hypothetical protein